MTNMIFLIGLSLIAYLIGSIPTGYWYARYFHGIDVTKHGSKNIGATNVARVLGSKKHFFLIFFIDAAKAYGTLWLARNVVSGNQLLIIAGLLLIGNAYSIFLRFNGGKGVATTVGIIASLFSVYFLVLFLISWGLILLMTRQPFLASLVSLFLLLILYFFVARHSDALCCFLIIVFGLSIWLHRKNIQRFII